MNMMPMYVVWWLLLFLYITSNRLLGIRSHAMQGHAFLTHSLEVFKINECTEEAQLTVEKALTEVFNIRYSVSGRIALVIFSQLIMIMLMFATLTGHNIWFLNVIAALTFGASVVVYKESVTDESRIDVLCEACNDDLVKIGHDEEYQLMLEEKHDDPVD